jgi:L-alanine-DL-glutamate epimerase-like enolase superfamily enzyme
MPRSGTTLLRLMLDAHPQLAIPLETHFLVTLVQLSSEKEVSRETLLKTVVEFHTWPDFHLSAEDFTERLDRVTPFNLTAGLRCFYGMYAEKFGKNRWGDKSPPYGFIMGAIHKLLPEAHFIHVIRDGRDAALSHRKTYFWRDRGIDRHAAEWRKRILNFREQAAGVPYIELRYEDLLLHTTAVLREICEFLQLQYTPEMESYHTKAQSRMDELADLPKYPFGDLKRQLRLNTHKLTSSPPDPSRITRWREEMPREELQAYEEIAGDLLSSLGYELACTRPAHKSVPDGTDNLAKPASGHESPPDMGAPAVVGALSPIVKGISLTWVQVPFRPRAAQHMVRELDRWKYFEVCQVELQSGISGFGETMLFYTWGRVREDSIARVLGRSAAEVMWDDSLGAGLQQALFDAVGRLYDLPIHRLLGAQVRDRAPISWWAVDMPGEDWAAECGEAIQEGYTSLKTKPRPWFDLKEQCRVLAKSLPENFKVGLDFNGSLLDAERATPYLREIEKFPQVAIFEEPIPRDDFEGYRRVHSDVSTPIALHSGKPPILQAVKEEICDGFVLSHGGASEILQQAHAAAAADKPFWLQQVGTGITAAFSLHFAAVSSHAKWSATTCHQLFEYSMIHPAIAVQDGTAAVPEAPGLGFELDRDALETFSIDRFGRDPYPVAGQLIAIRWPSGTTSYYAHARQYWQEFLDGRHPIFEEGVFLESINDDGSSEWKELQERATQGGVHSEGRPF